MLREQKHGRGEFVFPEILWILQFLSQCTKQFLWYEQWPNIQTEKPFHGYQGPGCVPVPFTHLHMEAWVVKIKGFFSCFFFFFCCDMLQRSHSLAFSRILKVMLESKKKTKKKKEQSQEALSQTHSVQIRPESPPVSSSPHVDLHCQQMQLNLPPLEPRAGVMEAPSARQTHATSQTWSFVSSGITGLRWCHGQRWITMEPHRHSRHCVLQSDKHLMSSLDVLP